MEELQEHPSNLASKLDR